MRRGKKFRVPRSALGTAFSSIWPYTQESLSISISTMDLGDCRNVWQVAVEGVEGTYFEKLEKNRNRVDGWRSEENKFPKHTKG